MFSLEDTIIARATSCGCGLRGVLRLSGEGCLSAVNDILRVPFVPDKRPRVYERHLVLWEKERPIPVRIFFWPKGHGYTGQTSLELHLWGSEPILEAVQQRILALAAPEKPIRLAQAGEFTLRAFLAGRMDLPQAEAVLGIIDAHDAHRLEIALNQLAGGIGRPLHEVREDLLETLSHLEAGFDFVDEDIAFISETQLRERIVSAIGRLEMFVKQIESRNIAGETPRVLLSGPPNAGKSSLFNAIVGVRRRALVSPIPGTTRDYLEAPVLVRGFEFQLVDTAGLIYDHEFKLSETPELAAQQFSKAELRRASLILFCTPDCGNHGWDGEGCYEFGDSIFSSVPVIPIRTKCDWDASENPSEEIRTSVKTGLGIETLKETIREKLLGDFSRTEVVPATAVRSRWAIEKSLECLHTASELYDESLIADELRAAVERLGEVLGTVYTEDILDRVFSRFCVGK